MPHRTVRTPLLRTAVFGCAAIALFPACDKARTGPTGSETKALVRVTATGPARKSLRRTTTQPARIAAFEQTPIHAKVDGYVQKTRAGVDEEGKTVDKAIADIGDPVAEGEVLAELWVPEMQDDFRQKEALVEQAVQEVKQAESTVLAVKAAVTVAKAQIQEAAAATDRAIGESERWQSEHARITELVARGSVSKKLADETLNQVRAAEAGRREAQAKVESANARLAEAEAKVRKAGADEAAARARLTVAQTERDRVTTLLGYAKLRAPFSGVVTQRNVDTGHYVRPPQAFSAVPLFVVARMDTVRVFVDVPELEAPLVDIGDSATIRMEGSGGQHCSGAVTRTAQVLSPPARTLLTEVDLPNPDGRWRPGMYATATITLAKRDDVLTLPMTAIMQDGPQHYCYAVESGRIVRKPITLGLQTGGEVEVVSGLSGPETVVLENPASLSPGQSVEVAPPKSR